MDVTGYVYFSPSSCVLNEDNNIWSTGSGGYQPVEIYARQGIPNIPVVLIRVQDGTVANPVRVEYACVKTDSVTDDNNRKRGQYSFTNVPIGDYEVIEAAEFDEISWTEWTIDFELNKQSVTDLTQEITPKDPSVEYILSAKININNANRIVSLNANRRVIRVHENSIQDIYTNTGSFTPINDVTFIDAPQRCEALVLSDFLQFQNAVIKGQNMLSYCNRGTFGSCPSGTPMSTSFLNAYPSENFTEFVVARYSDTSPQNDKYSIVNIAGSSTFGKSWFDSADHTIGDERGRFMIVNGDKAGKYFFKQSISIEPNTAYLFSCWAMNMMRFTDSDPPKFSIKIFDEDNNLIFYSMFNENNPLIPIEIPVWKQIGTIITPDDILNKTNLTIEFVSEGMEAAGNDYAVDDITVVALKRGVVAEKKLDPDKQNVELGGELNYVCTIKNLNDEEAITHVMFKDFIQDGLIVKDNKILISCSEIQDEEFIMEDIIGVNAKFDSAGINIGELLARLVDETDPYYVDLKLERIPAGLTVTIKFTVIVNSINKEEPYNNIKNRFRVQFLSELDNQDLSRPRTVASNEVITPVIFPDLDAEKSLSIIENGEPIEISQGGSVDVGSDIVYSIKITNSGKLAVNELTLSDEFDRLFLYNFPDPECSIRVTTQITSPSSLEQQEEQRVPCTDIISYGSYGITINNISIPAAVETEKGICIVRIYGKIQS